MGVYVTRTLKSNYHVQTYIKDNMDNTINFISRILAEHGNLNRVEFGDALWNSVLRPDLQFHIVVELGLHPLKKTKIF